MAPNGPAYNIKTYLKYISKTKTQPKEYLGLKNIVIYTPHLKSRKN